MSRHPVWQRIFTRPQFRIFRGDQPRIGRDEPEKRWDEGTAVVLPFLRLGRRRIRVDANPPSPRLATIETPAPTNSRDPLARARILHENRCCPSCRRGGTIPLDLGDGDRCHGAMPIPGTATLIGFYCQSCGAEWSL